MTMEEKYPELFNEFECINRANGTHGILDAVMYIDANFECYEGTKVARQYRAFCAQMRQLFV